MKVKRLQISQQKLLATCSIIKVFTAHMYVTALRTRSHFRFYTMVPTCEQQRCDEELRGFADRQIEKLVDSLPIAVINAAAGSRKVAER